MRPYASLRTLMGPYGFLKVLMHPYVSLWVFISVFTCALLETSS